MLRRAGTLHPENPLGLNSPTKKRKFYLGEYICYAGVISVVLHKGVPIKHKCFHFRDNLMTAVMLKKRVDCSDIRPEHMFVSSIDVSPVMCENEVTVNRHGIY